MTGTTVLRGRNNLARTQHCAWSRSVMAASRRPLDGLRPTTGRSWSRTPPGAASRTHTCATTSRASRDPLTSALGVTQWTREHDAVGNALTDTDANAHATTSTYDAANQRVHRHAPWADAACMDFVHVADERIGSRRPHVVTTDAADAVTRYDYNLRDQLLASTNGANETTTFTVDGDGLQRTRELAGKTWTNTFDAAHRLRTVTRVRRSTPPATTTTPTTR